MSKQKKCVILSIFFVCVIAASSILIDGSSLDASSGADHKIKNVIILIGDGMGYQAAGLLEMYARYADNEVYPDKKTALSEIMEKGVIGNALHNAQGVLVTDSAASATQMASGKFSLSEAIGIDKDGHKTTTILEIAEEMGKSTGLVSDTRITHATPAGFAAHQTHRTKENEIAVDLLNSGADVLLSGGLRYWIPQDISNMNPDLYNELVERTQGKISIKSKRKDDRNLLDEAGNKGYSVALTKQEMEQADGDKLLGLFQYSAFDYRIDIKDKINDPQRTIPTLKEMAQKSIEVLSKNENGFFLMVESGLIDWAEHDNDAGALLYEMIRFDETLKYLYNWVKDRDDTLFIVTADHETGSFGFSYSRRNIPEESAFPGDFSNELFSPKFSFGSFDILTKIAMQKKSYAAMLLDFSEQSGVDLYDRLNTGDVFTTDNCNVFRDIVNDNTEFDITLEETKEILTTEVNEYKVEGHSYLGYNYFPKVNDYKEFYVYETEVFKDLIARIVGKQQYAVWSTGTHTNTPVPIIALGPENVTKGFGKMMHTTEWAQLAIDIMKNGDAGPVDDTRKFDLNGDGAVTLGDLIHFIKYFTGLN